MMIHSLRKQVFAYIFAIKYLPIMETRRDVFQAIADPTRRQIIEMVAQRSLNVNEIAENFDVSRQAVSLHVKILMECGLVAIKKQGRERYCEAKLDQLNDVAEWVEYCKQFWSTQFNSLEKYLKKEHISKKRKK
jgi:DNA-binding transcriptional ArsR family regulator